MEKLREITFRGKRVDNGEDDNIIDNIKVIGNIHDNPELLTNKNNTK